MDAPLNEQAALTQFLGRVRRAYRLGATRLALARLGWTALEAAAALMALDAIWALPGGTRLWLVRGAPLIVGVAALITWLRASRAQSLERHIARRIETGCAPLENDLINAVEFSGQLPATANPTTAGLMQAAIGRAVGEIEPVRDWSPLVSPRNLRREGRTLLLAVALAVTGGFLFSPVLRAVGMRYLDPLGDHPPYSPTRIRVAPDGARVDYGDHLTVKAYTSGVPAREAQLVIEDLDGYAMNALPMFENDNGEFFQTIENIREPMKYYVRVPRGRSRRFDLSLNKTPRIESAELSLRPPAYTHQPEQTRLLSQNTLKSLAGSVARLRFTSNRPLAGGQLRLGEQSVKLEPDGANAVGGSVELTTGGEVTAEVIDTEGNSSGPAWHGRVEMLPDDRPSISIISPGMDSFAIPTAKLPIVIEADDDLGFKDVALVRNINDSMDFRKEMYAGDGSERFVHSVEMLDLADLGARPGDVISYYATASDSRPDAPQTAASPAFQLAIISEEEYRQFMQQRVTAEDLQQKYREYQDRLEQLAREQATLRRETQALEQKAEAGQAMNAAEKEQLADAQRRQSDLARQTENLAGDMRREADNPPIFDIEKSFKEELAEFSKGLNQAQSNMQGAGQSMGQAGEASNPAQAGGALGQAGAQQDQALAALNRTAQEYQEGIGEAGRQLANAARLMEDVERFKSLYQRQKELERQARLFKDMPDPGLDDRVRMKELGEEETDVRGQLERLAKDLESHAAEVEKDLPKVADDARRIAAEIASRQIPGLMDKAQDRLSAADGPRGHPPAAEAKDQMEAMISFCNSAGGNMAGELGLKISMGSGMQLGQTLAQMAAGMGNGIGRLGANGQGSGGNFGSASQFAMFGSESYGQPTRDSRVSGSPSHGQTPPGEEAASISSGIEEIAIGPTPDEQVKIGEGERVMEEYRLLIEAYFRGLAEEQK